MASFRKLISNIFVWTYDRGTLQYDIICALILAFIFFVPPSCFVSKRAKKEKPAYQNSQTVPQNSQTDAFQQQVK